MLVFKNGEAFATGVLEYDFKAASVEDTNARILMRIEVDDIPAVAALDTGAPYLVLAPIIANRLSFDPAISLEPSSIRIRGIKFYGNLYRVEVLLPAFEGESHLFQATAFVPNLEEEVKWGSLPSFLGMQSCLERVRFAIDPGESKFYFGALP